LHPTWIGAELEVMRVIGPATQVGIGGTVFISYAR